ncbi:hypothetical protein Tco_0559573 [Tanacetum coccineum]
MFIRLLVSNVWKCYMLNGLIEAIARLLEKSSKLWKPEYLQELLQSLLKDLQILNAIQPLKQEISNQIQKDQEEKSIAELLAEERLQKDNQALNERIREISKGEIEFDYRENVRKDYVLKDNSMEIVKACVDDDDTDDDDDDDSIPLGDIIARSKAITPDLPIEEPDNFLKEIDLFLTSDDSMPPGIESDDYDSEGDFRFLEELLINDSLPLPENESYNLDSFDNPESPVVKSCFDFEPVAAVANDFDVLNNDESFDSGEGENVVLDEEEDTFTFTTRSFLPFVTYPEVLPTSYSTGSEDKVFKPGKDNKDESGQNQSKPTRNGKDKTREKFEKTKAGSARYKERKPMKVKGLKL